jgi:rRNA maturation endonuclease Nob1
MIAVAAVVLALAAISFVLFVREKDVPEPIPVSPVEHLEDRKRAIYDNLRDLQFEYRLGKLSDEDYQQTKQALQRELAIVLSEIESVSKKLGLTPARAASKPAAVKPSSTVCPHCGAQFPQSLKFCGECGKVIA